MEALCNPRQTVIVKCRKWEVDNEIPVYSKDRDYVERLI